MVLKNIIFCVFPFLKGRGLFCNLKSILHVIWLMALYPLVACFPRDSKKIVFGAWCGNQFSDNPKYFLKYIIDLNMGYRCYWFGNPQIRNKVESFGNVKFVRKGSLMSVWHILTARWAVSNLGFDCDVSTFPTYGRIKLLSFWHGTMYKGPSAHYDEVVLSSNLFKRIWQLFTIRQVSIPCPLYAYASFSFEGMRELTHIDCPWQYKKEMSIAQGTARIDYLVNNASNADEIKRVREKISKTLGLPLDKKWYLYMPTFRKGLEVLYTFSRSRYNDELQTILLQQEAILIEKQHPQVIRAHKITGGRTGNVYFVSHQNAEVDIDTQELLLASERLISDYSACFCDYEVLNRPVIHFAYDYEQYASGERKDAFKLRDVSAGPVVQSELDLLRVLSLSDKDLLALKGPKAGMMIEGEKGRACETFAKWVGLI